MLIIGVNNNGKMIPAVKQQNSTQNITVARAYLVDDDKATFRRIQN